MCGTMCILFSLLHNQYRVCSKVVKCAVHCAAQCAYREEHYVISIACAVQHTVCISPMKGPARPIMRAGFNNGREGSNVLSY